MTCTELTNDLLVDYADWRIGPEERSQVTRHLERCETCRVRREDLEIMTGALGRSAEPPPAALVRQLDRSILGEPGGPKAALRSGPPLRVHAGRLAGIAAGLLLAALGGFVAGRGGVPGSLWRGSAPASSPAAPEPPVAESRRDPSLNRLPPPPGPVGARSGPPASPAGGASPAPLAAQPSGPRPAAPLPLLGDLNGDGVVDIADVRILEQRILLRLPIPPQADVNGDGVVDIADVRALLRAVLEPR